MFVYSPQPRPPAVMMPSTPLRPSKPWQLRWSLPPPSRMTAVVPPAASLTTQWTPEVSLGGGGGERGRKEGGVVDVFIGGRGRDPSRNNGSMGPQHLSLG